MNINQTTIVEEQRRDHNDTMPDQKPTEMDENCLEFTNNVIDIGITGKKVKNMKKE